MWSVIRDEHIQHWQGFAVPIFIDYFLFDANENAHQNSSKNDRANPFLSTTDNLNLVKNHAHQLSKNPQNHTSNFTTFSQNDGSHADENAEKCTDFDDAESGFFADEFLHDFSVQEPNFSSTKCAERASAYYKRNTQFNIRCYVWGTSRPPEHRRSEATRSAEFVHYRA